MPAKAGIQAGWIKDKYLVISGQFASSKFPGFPLSRE
jgi:hypothetical protein